MSEQKWSRDKTPYLVFPCKHCHQYSYVKLTQKTKKCLRCGHLHKVKSVIPTGQIIEGMTAALDFVKERQGEINGSPQFEADTSFTIITNVLDKDSSHMKEQKNENSWFRGSEEETYQYRFIEILKKLKLMHQSFPKYMIETMADEYFIPRQEIPRLLRTMINQGILSYNKENKHYFLLNSRNAS
jgi:hypothetical protein